MNDHDRKKLWGESAGTCNICRQFLFHEADHPADGDALVGEEAHIISRSRKGPRGSAGVEGMDFDGYYNRILLCRIDHRIIDTQPHKFTVEKLREMKSGHERWVRRTLHTMDEPIGPRPKFPGRGMLLPRIRTGADAWHVVVGSSFYLLNPVEEDSASPEFCDVADEFLTNLRDYGEIHDSVTDRGFGAIREAQRDLRRDLDHLTESQLIAFGAQREMLITGAGQKPWPARMAVVVIRPRAEIGDEESLPIIFAAQAASA